MKITKNYKKISKELKAKEDCPGIIWKLKNDNGDGDFDEELLPLLKLLNTPFWHTTASCAGHSLAYLKNPGRGYCSKNPYQMTIFIHAQIKEMPIFMKLMEELAAVSKGHFWCELGYDQEDYSNQVEVGYLPFKIKIYCWTKAVRDRLLKLYEKIAKK